MMKHVLIGVGLIAAQLAAPARTDPGLKRRDVTVNTADLDLSGREGIVALDRRLAKAVLKACGTAHYLESDQVSDLELCRAGAFDQAMALRHAVVKRQVGWAKLAGQAPK